MDMRIVHVFIYLGLLWLRLLAATFPGYVHPNEFFQSPEITAGSLLGLATRVSWEYQPEHAIHSILSPFMTSGLPFLWLHKHTGLLESSTLLLAPRVGSVALSILTDATVFLICGELGRHPAIPAYLIATSQAVLVYCVRPFVQTTETALLGLCLYLYILSTKKRQGWAAFGLGSVFALGVFAQVTSALFTIPILFAFVWTSVRQQGSIRALFPCFLGISIATAFCVVMDSLYYGSMGLVGKDGPIDMTTLWTTMITSPLDLVGLSWQGTWTLTPANYMSHVIHDLRPQLVHLLTNLPLMFAPLVVVVMLQLPYTLGLPNRDPNRSFFFVLLSCTIVPVAGLSLMRYQEPQSLVPLIIPLALLFEWNQETNSILFWFLWFVFNMVSTLMMGVMHQGGIVPAMSFLQQQTLGIHGCAPLSGGNSILCDLVSVEDAKGWTDEHHLTTHLIFYKTSMPPHYLLGYPTSWQGNKSLFLSVTDVGDNLNWAQVALEQRQGVTLRRFDRTHPQIEFAKTPRHGDTIFERTLIIAPSRAVLPQLDEHRFKLVATYFPHLSGYGDMANTIHALMNQSHIADLLSLNVYLLLSNQDDWV